MVTRATWRRWKRRARRKESRSGSTSLRSCWCGSRRGRSWRGRRSNELALTLTLSHGRGESLHEGDLRVLLALLEQQHRAAERLRNLAGALVGELLDRLRATVAIFI